MDELAVARAELTRLEDSEQKLVEQLSDVRVAAAAQRKRINELIQKRPPIIERLPIEMLSSILHLALGGTNPSRKEILTCVSRHWRGLILDQPSFWSTIEVDSRQSLDRVRERLKKSREAPLDITIRHESPESYVTIREGLDLLVPCANRWRSLSICTPTQMGILVSQFILDRIGGIKFPSLKYVKFKSRVTPFPTFLSPTNVPVLEHLEIRNEFPNLRPTPGSTSFSEYIPVLTLVTLSLSGDIPSWILQPNGVHFPVLETLKIDVENADGLFKATVAPKLKSFDYTVISDNSLSTIFSGLEGKFSSVEQVSFTIPFDSLDTPDALALCRAFPHVCHAEFFSDFPLSACFGPCEGVDASQSPADYWKSLESLAFRDIDPDMWLEPPIRERNAFVQWLVARQGQRPLRVRIENFSAPEDDSDVGSFCMLYDILREHCTVELKDIRLWYKSELSKSADSRLQLHVPMFTSGLADDISAVVGGIEKSGQASHE